MELNQLMKLSARSKKRVGRGIGSGKGKTAGRGTKGQKARGSVPLGFIGGTLPLYKKLPYRRGLGNPKLTPNVLPVSLAKLTVFKENAEVDLQALVEKGLVDEKKARKQGVKIVANGEVEKALTVKLPVSSSAAKKIEKAGGKVING